MKLLSAYRSLVWVLALGVMVGLVSAQDGKPAPVPAPTGEEGEGLLPGFRNIDEILEQAVRNIGARYNLNAEQSRYTDTMMKTEVRTFLREHRDQIWPVLRSMIGAQLDPTSITKDKTESQRIGKTARPLFDSAREAILRCNEEWRTQLTAEQRAMHDFDMGEMQKTFGYMTEQIQAWEDGKPGDKGIFPAVQAFPNEPKLPPVPPAGLPSLRGEKASSAEEGGLTPDVFEAYVEAFIKDYELDAAQTERARGMLTEFKGLAQNQYDTIKDQLARIDHDRQEAVIKRDRAAKEGADKKRRELLAPVSEAFGKMKDRLHALLTTAQKERYAQKEAAKKNAPAPKDKPAEKPAEKPVAKPGENPPPKPADKPKDAPKPPAKPADPPKKDDKPATDKPKTDQPPKAAKDD